MIFITGDTHGDYRRLNSYNFPEQKMMTKKDYMIICGDFGGIWSQDPKDKTEQYWLGWLEKKNFTTLFIDGNHENYDRLSDMEVEFWNGGKIHKIRPSIYHLMRGQVFQIDGNTFFTFGGAKSHDISDGILEIDEFRKKNKRSLSGKMYRVNRLSWWKEELPSIEEMEEGRKSLERVSWNVDFIVTHCAATSMQKQINLSDYDTNYLTDYLEEIHQKCCYRYWFCGHYHNNINLNEKDKELYKK